MKTLLGKANFPCVLGPNCYEACNGCETCRYAQDQLKHLILREPTSGQCPQLEKCALSCLDDQVSDPFECVFRSRCVHFCLDNRDCPQCYDIVKRIFTGYCFRSGFIDHYKQRCRPLFDELAADFVAKF
ncbi:Protein DCT-5 [Aphelenchoides avenae]|nr:Protein DCT-5 [Aphelenchus avenae]